MEQQFESFAEWVIDYFQKRSVNIGSWFAHSWNTLTMVFHGTLKSHLCTVGHGSEWLPGATHPKNDPPYHSSKFWYIGGILAKEARLYLKLASNTEQIYLEGW